MNRLPVWTQITIALIIALAAPGASAVAYGGAAIAKQYREELSSVEMEKLKASRRLMDMILDAAASSAHKLAVDADFGTLGRFGRYSRISGNYANGLAAKSFAQELSGLVRSERMVTSAFFMLTGADYVISSDKGVVPLENYPSLDWLRSVPKGRGVSGSWVAREHKTITVRDSLSGISSGATVSMLSYVFPLNILVTSTSGVIVLNVRERDLSEVINGGGAAGAYGAMIVDSSGKMLSHPDPANFLTPARNLPYVDAVFDDKASSGSLFITAGDTELLCVFDKDSSTGRVLLFVKPVSALAERGGVVAQGMALAAVLAASASAFVCALLFIRYLEPLRKLRGAAASQNVSDRNDFSFALKAYQSAIAGEGAMRERLGAREKSAMLAVASGLLIGDKPSPQDEPLLRSYFPHPYFQVAVMYIDGYNAYRDATNKELRANHRRLAASAVKEAFKGYHKPFYVGLLGGRSAVIINLPSTRQDQIPDDLWDTVISKLADTHGASVTIGVSRVVSGDDGIYSAARQATEAVDFRVKNGGGKAYKWHKSAANRMFYYPDAEESKILGFLENGDMDSIADELEKLRHNLRESSGVSAANIHIIYVQLLSAALRGLPEGTRARRLGLYRHLAECETLEELDAAMREFFADAVRERKGETRETETALQKALRYIGERFTKDVDFYKMAEDIGVSYSNLRRIVRESTGKSLLDHLNMRRVRQAKSLLAGTNEPLPEVAVKSGFHNTQSLSRFFNKYEGLTPGEYRTRMSGKAN